MLTLGTAASLLSAGNVLNNRIKTAPNEPFAPLYGGDAYQSDGLAAANAAFTAAARARGPIAEQPQVRAAVERPHMGHYSDLAGTFLPANDAFHGNMVPFYGQRVKQNLDPNANSTILETYTGSGGTQRCSKREQPSFSDQSPAPIHGMGNVTDFIQSRNVQSHLYNNVQPFEQVRVGPGLNQGFTNRPSGGFHDLSVQQAAMPKSVDELRAGSQPKLSFEGRLLPGGNSSERGLVPAPTTYKDPLIVTACNRELLPTRAAVTAHKSVPITFVKPTERGSEEPYLPPAVAVVPAKGEQGELTAWRRKQEACEPPVGALYTSAGPTEGDDHGRSAIQLGPSVREYMHEPSRPGILSAVVKALTAPFTDVARSNMKDLNLLPAREFGVGIQPQLPSKGTTYDPSDATRTTIKETLIHDVHEGYITGPKCIYEYKANDVRTTMRQTLANVEAANLKTHNRGKLGPTQKPRTTVRETVIREGAIGIAKGVTQPGSASFIVRSQNRETTTIDDYVGAADMAGAVGGYHVSPANAPMTGREVPHEYMGPAQSAHLSDMLQDADRAARVNDHRELVLEGRTPTLSGPKTYVGGSDALHESAPADRCVGQMSTPIQRVFQETPCAESLNPTIDRNVYVEKGRLDPALVESLRSNPYIPRN
jgi:hypothetical protein